LAGRKDRFGRNDYRQAAAADAATCDEENGWEHEEEETRAATVDANPFLFQDYT
jgi:hypothetical protein